jgi:hypothetical protein
MLKNSGMTTGGLDDYHYKIVELKRKIDKMVIFIKGSLAVLNQKKTFPADIKAAKEFLLAALKEV